MRIPEPIVDGEPRRILGSRSRVGDLLSLVWQQFSILVITIFLLTACVTAPVQSVVPQSHYVRDDGQPLVFVFVHGVFGNGTTTWTNSRTNAYFPGLLAADSAFTGADVYVYEYPTPFAGDTFRINELAENMRLVLARDDVLKRRELIFVAHSMGGLLTRALLLKYREIAQHVSFIYLFATPTTGSEIARIGQILSSNPQVGQMVRLDPALADLQRDWLAANLQIATYCAYERRPTFGVGIVVDQQSAMSLCNRPVDPIDADHVEIVKPAGRSDTPYSALFEAFRNTPRLSVEADTRRGSTPEAPDVTLRFLYSSEPVLQLLNQSDVIARDIKWSVVLWNLDLPERNDPLPIPVATFDWIRPRQAGGPQGLFLAPSVRSLLRPGNRLVGSASVICPNCARGHTFFIYIVWGEGGWFTEIADMKDGEVFIPKRFTKTAIADFAKELLKTPEGSRTAIVDP